LDFVDGQTNPSSDPLPWQCLSRYPEISKQALFIDIDYKDLILKKRAMIQATDQLSSYFTNVIISESEVSFESDQYVQMGCDLRDLKLLEDTLKKIIDPSKARILFVAEVSITYMEKKTADDLVHWAAKLPDGMSTKRSLHTLLTLSSYILSPRTALTCRG
jgi:tRNA wybutosine-synthesizing protein 4